MMQSNSSAPSTTTRWTGIILSALSILFLLFDGVIKVMQRPEAVKPTTELGYAANLLVPIGLIELVCLLLYALPGTSVLGAILLTGYLGGAVATNLRAEMPTFNIIFPFIIGAMIWGGLFLREPRLRALLPWRRN
jgi:hypothetical protein